MSSRLWPCLLFFAQVLLVCTQIAPEYALAAHLFTGYNNFVSPYVNRQNSTNNVLVSINLEQANERDWTVSLLTTMNYGWIDPRLRWDPADFDDITEISVKSSAVWIPAVYPCESSSVITVLPDANSALIRYTGEVALDVYQMTTYACPMIFDAFPFDVQNCVICFALDGFSGTPVSLVDVSSNRPDLLGNSDWRFVNNLTMGLRKLDLDPNSKITTSKLGYHFSIARRSFFWVTLVIVPTLLISIVALLGIFSASEERIVENAISIGLTTMTSLMLVVTILADSLAKADNLPGLGWFVLIDITIVCAAVIAALTLDHCRTLAIEWSRVKTKAGERKGKEPEKIDRISRLVKLLVSKRGYRNARILFFLLTILGLVFNISFSWTIPRVMVQHSSAIFLDRNKRPPPPPVSP